MPSVTSQEAAEIVATRAYPVFSALGRCQFRKDLQVVLDSGVSQNGLAQILGVHQQTLNRWALGTRPCRDRFIHLAVRECAEGLREARA